MCVYVYIYIYIYIYIYLIFIVFTIMAFWSKMMVLSYKETTANA